MFFDELRILVQESVFKMEKFKYYSGRGNNNYNQKEFSQSLFQYYLLTLIMPDTIL